MHLYSHPDCVSHQTPEGHPERSERLSFLLEQLEQTGFTQDYPLLEAPPIDKDLIAYGRVFNIVGVDKMTQDYYLNRYHRHFPLGDIQPVKPRDAVVV